MRSFALRHHFVASVFLAQLGLFLVGCNKDEGAVVNFPKSDVQPALSDTKTTEDASGTTSQGDPSQYTR